MRFSLLNRVSKSVVVVLSHTLYEALGRFLRVRMVMRASVRWGGNSADVRRRASQEAVSVTQTPLVLKCVAVLRTTLLYCSYGGEHYFFVLCSVFHNQYCILLQREFLELPSVRWSRREAFRRGLPLAGSEDFYIRRLENIHSGMVQNRPASQF